MFGVPSGQEWSSGNMEDEILNDTFRHNKT
jgi:hypothetical protein